MRKLTLKKETLADLTTDDLRNVVGGAESVSCPMTYTCGCTITSGGVSNNCTNITNAIILPGGC